MIFLDSIDNANILERSAWKLLTFVVLTFLFKFKMLLVVVAF